MTPVEGIYPIGDLVREMCARLGLDPNRVARLDIEPARLEATMRAEVYRTKVDLRKGRKPYRYVAPETNEAAFHVFEFRVITAS